MNYITKQWCIFGLFFVGCIFEYYLFYNEFEGITEKVILTIANVSFIAGLYFQTKSNT